MFWNSVDTFKGFRIVTDKVVHITSINTTVSSKLFRRQRNEIHIFNTYAKPDWYFNRKWYKSILDEE